MLLLLGFAFLSGILTILAPCIWPVLPIIFSPSIAGKDYDKPFGIVFGVLLSFAFFTFFLSIVLQYFNIDTIIPKSFGAFVTAFFGLLLITPQLMKKIDIHISRFVRLLAKRNNWRSTFWDGIITGVCLGIIWSPSAGPIVATISSLTSSDQLFLTIFSVTVMYVIGIGLPLIVIAYAGQRIFSHKKISIHSSRIQQGIGVMMILSGVMMYTSIDVLLLQYVQQVFPQIEPLLQGF
jgi:cytochrome c biogenesis protein CcdA